MWKQQKLCESCIININRSENMMNSGRTLKLKGWKWVANIFSIIFLYLSMFSVRLYVKLSFLPKNLEPVEFYTRQNGQVGSQKSVPAVQAVIGASDPPEAAGGGNASPLWLVCWMSPCLFFVRRRFCFLWCLVSEILPALL